MNSSEESKGLRLASTKPGEHGKCLFTAALFGANDKGEATSIVKYCAIIRARLNRCPPFFYDGNMAVAARFGEKHRLERRSPHMLRRILRDVKTLRNLPYMVRRYQ